MAKDFDFETPAQAGNRIDFEKAFFKPEEGLNLIRIVSLSGKSFKSFFVADKTGKKRFVRSPGAGCPLTISGLKPSTRYFLKIIDRKTNTLKVWEFGSQIKTQIQELVDDVKTRGKGQEALTEYNIEVRRRAKGANPLYGISLRERLVDDPRHQSILSNDEKIIAEDNLNLEELSKPWSVERINSQILGIETPQGGAAPAAPVAQAAVATAARPQGATATATVAKPDVAALNAKASALGGEDDSWLND